MQNRNHIASNIRFFISNKDKLALRQVCHANKESLEENHVTPYQNKVDFLIAVDHLYTTKTAFESAWDVYYSAISSTSLKPAILYKLKDIRKLTLSGTFVHFADGEDLEATGRRYYPLVHNWDVNQAWMLAQLHHGRYFVLYSELTPAYIKATGNSNHYSALAKEVATAIKAGYTISINREGYPELSPSNEQSKQLCMAEVKLSDKEIQSAINSVNHTQAVYRTEVDIHERVAFAFTMIKETLNAINTKKDIKNYPAEEFDKVISNAINYFYVNSQDRKFALACFINIFNKELSPSNTVPLKYNDNIDTVKAAVFNVFEDKVSSILLKRKKHKIGCQIS